MKILKTILAIVLLQMLLWTLGCSTIGTPVKTEESEEPAASVSSDSNDWESTMALLNELKELLLEQPGLFNVRRGEDGGITVEPREDIQVDLNTERISELMDELRLYMVYVRPEEEYFGFKTSVEILTCFRPGTDLCYSSVSVPEYSWTDETKEWMPLGDGWYHWVVEEI